MALSTCIYSVLGRVHCYAGEMSSRTIHDFIPCRGNGGFACGPAVGSTDQQRLVFQAQQCRSCGTLVETAHQQVVEAQVNKIPHPLR